MKTNPKLFNAKILFIFFVMVSCEEKTIEPPELKQYANFSLESFDDAIQENLTIHFDDFQEAKIRNEQSAASRSADASYEKWIEYNTGFHGHIVVEDSASSRNIFFTLLEHVSDAGSSVFMLLKFVPSIALDSSKVYSYFNLQDFSGTIYTYNQFAEMEYAIGVTDGRVQDFTGVGNEAQLHTSGARVQIAFPPPDPCYSDVNKPCGDGDGGGGGGGRMVSVKYKEYTDWYQITTVGNSSYIQYLGSDYVLKTRYVWVSGGTSPSPGSTPQEGIVPHEHISKGNAGHPTSSPHPNEYLKMSRLELESMLKDDPFALIENCAQIQAWRNLAQNEASTAIKDKINQLQSQNNSFFDDWAIQTINGAKGTIVNMDYFSVNVAVLPINPISGQRFSANGFLDYFRRNINSFVSGSTFEPYCETPSLCSQETALWNSNNPTGAIIYIDIPVDDGAVICSEYESDYWLFMTLEAPGAGNHPVSGTRQFGYEPNGSGGYSFFVKGVDRFDSNTMENMSYMTSLILDIDNPNPFFGADELWESFQSKLNQFINDYGGSAQVVKPVKNRTDWEKVKEVLDGTRPISDLGCN